MSAATDIKYRRAPPPIIETAFAADTGRAPADLRLIRENERLRAQIIEQISSINNRCRAVSRQRAASVNVARGPAKSAATLKSEISTIEASIGRMRMKIEKCHQNSSLRGIEDRIEATRKQLTVTNTEIKALNDAAVMQTHILNKSQTNLMIQNLECELTNQKRQHSELRRASVDVEQQLRTKQRLCAQMEEQLGSMGIRPRSATSSVRSIREDDKENSVLLPTEIVLFSEEAQNLTADIKRTRAQLLELEATRTTTTT